MVTLENIDILVLIVFYLHMNPSLWKLVTVEKSMGSFVYFRNRETGDWEHLINQTLNS